MRPEAILTGASGVWKTHSPAETFQLGFEIGRSVIHPVMFLLQGELGAGKTVFAKGVVCGLGHSDPDEVTSPSFTLINEYDLRMKVYHLDLYRLETPAEIASLELEEIFSKPAVILIEWAERLQLRDIEGAVLVAFSNDLGNDERTITIRPYSSGLTDIHIEGAPEP